MSDKVGNNSEHHFLPNANASAVAPAAGPSMSRSQRMREIQYEQNLRLDEMLRDQFQLPRQLNMIARQSQTLQQDPKRMAMTTENGVSSLPSSSQPRQPQRPSFMMPFPDISDDDHDNFHHQDCEFEPERIQLPSRRGRQQQLHHNHGRNTQITRSLPLMLEHNGGGGGLFPNTNKHNTPLSQSCPIPHQQLPTLDDLRNSIRLQEMQLQQLQQQMDNDTAASSSSLFQPSSTFFPSYPTQQQRGLSHSFTGMTSNKNNNVIDGMMMSSNSNSGSSNINCSDAAASYRRSASCCSTAASPLFHQEDPLGFCQGVNTNDNRSSHTKRRRLNSDQMLQMFLSDVTIGGKLVADSATSVATDADATSAAARESSRSVGNGIIDQSALLSPSPSPAVAGSNRSSLSLGNFPDYFFDTQDQEEGNAVDSNCFPPPPLLNSVSMTSDQEMMMMLMNYDPSTLSGEKEMKNQKFVDKTKNNHFKACTNYKDYVGHKKDTSNHIITPSSATISALTAEIRSQARKQEQRKEHTLSSASNDDDKTEDSSQSNQDKASSCTTSAATGLAQFASAMEASQTSQQNIHDWDKKFGLRRAHSKTMRESCRSRKKVLDFLKGEIKEGKGSILSALFASTGSSSSTSECPTALRGSSASTANNSIDDTIKNEQDDEQGQQSPFSSPCYDDGGGNEDRDMIADDEEIKEHSDNNDETLERMFRRASLDCVQQTSFHSVGSDPSDKSVADTLKPFLPQPQETDRIQFHANSA